MCATSAQPAHATTGAALPIALDAMGGDRAPGVVVDGAVQAARDYNLPILLVGRRGAIEAELGKHQTAGLTLEIVETDDMIGMHESPTEALKKKPRASLKLIVDLVKEGRACAAYSAGNTGAVLTAATLGLGRLPGIKRPALGSPYPTRTGGVTFLLDMGANAECKALYLVQFAAMGAAYMRLAFGRENPSIGLLSNGEEESKGTDLVKEAHALLAASALNFKGNIEAKDVPGGAVDVAVADGFAGNVLLKASEGTMLLVFDLMRAEVDRSWRYKIGGALLRPALRAVRNRLDFEEYGGAALLGVNGVVLKGHGRSGPRAIKNGVRVAHQMARDDLVGAIARELERVETAPAPL